LRCILRDGAITPKERAIMDALRRNLGITAKEAMRIERAVAAAVGVG
jgi:hypothetical protein